MPADGPSPAGRPDESGSLALNAAGAPCGRPNARPSRLNAPREPMPTALSLLWPHLLVVGLLTRPAASGGSAAAATASCAGQDGLSVRQLDQLYPAAAGKHSAHVHKHTYACLAPPNR
eukprot:COSAG01_NODE_5058_length_4519_cov_16.982127_2_plen_118_part_00